MSSMKRPDFGKFGKTSRKSVKISSEDMTRVKPLDPERKLPLVVEVAMDGIDPIAYAASNRELLERQLAEHGGILFRGFGFESSDRFQRFVAALSSGPLDYTERSSPRSRVSGQIFTSTDYPPDQPIFLHNEQSYNLEFPRKILFCCLDAADRGGATPIADSRRVLAEIPEEIREKFERFGYLYVRNFGDGFGLTWQETFGTDDRSEVEAYCHERRIEFEWKEGDRLRTRQRRPVTARHPVTGELTWFNHLTFFHVSSLAPSARDAVLEEFEEGAYPNNTYYGDGSPIEPEVMETLRAVYHRETLTFPWREGDVLMLDNMLSAHGREPFEGSRKVVVAMADPVRWDDVAA